MTQTDISRKQNVSPNPKVYPEAYQNNTDSRMMAVSTRQLGPQNESVAPRNATANNGKNEKVLVIPIQFTDVAFLSSSTVRQNLQDMMTGTTNSLRDYYEKNSLYISGTRGMTVDAFVTPVITSSKTMSYYGNDISGTDEDDSNARYIFYLADEALDIIAAGGGINLNDFDTNRDGIIDHLMIVHAGDGQENSRNSSDIWSHSWEIPYKGGHQPYTCVPETGTLGVYVHEFGHDIGLPDLYDADEGSNGNSNGVGNWDVMGSGSWNFMPGDEPGTCPANLSAWSKEYLGWSTVTDVTTNGAISIVNDNINDKAYRFWTNGDASGNEYYLSEYRRKNGYDAGLPGEGLLIWHVDKQWLNEIITVGGIQGTVLENNRVNSYASRLGVELEQADGKMDLRYMRNEGDDSDPFNGDSPYDSFSALPFGMNYSNITTTQFSYVDVKNISTIGATAIMDISLAATAPANAPELISPAAGSAVDKTCTFTWKAVSGAETYKLQIGDDSGFTTLSEYILGKTSNITYNNGLYSYTITNTGEKTYYWRVAAMNYSGMGPWSSTRSYSTTDSTKTGSPAAPLNLRRVSATDTSINIAWDVTSGAAAYYLLADGIEEKCLTNSYNHTGLNSNITHKYKVRAVTSTSTGIWSDELSATTAVVPTISSTTQNITEGNEQTGKINIELSDTTFRNDGVYNKATVTLDPTTLPEGVCQGEVTVIDPTHLMIALSSDSSEDYDNDLIITIKVAKEELTSGRFTDTTAPALFYAIVEPQSGVPDPAIIFSFDGANSGKLMGITSLMEYSLDGGACYTAATTNQALTISEMNSITAINDIKIRVSGNLRTPPGVIQTIDILPNTSVPNITGNDTTNTVTGMLGTMEYSTDGTNWIAYNGILPDLTGNVSLRLRYKASGVTAAGGITTINFTSPPPVTPPPPPPSGGDLPPVVPTVIPPSATTTPVAITIPSFGSNELGGQINNPNTKNVTANVASSTAQAITLDIVTYGDIVQKGKSFTVDGPKVDVTLPAGAVDLALIKSAGSGAQLKIGFETVSSGDISNKLKDAAQDDGKGLFAIGGGIYEFNAQIVSSGKTQVITGFNEPISITISLKDANLSGIDPDKLGVYYYNEITKSWDYIGGSYDPVTRTITFTTTHLSLYSVMEYERTFTDIKTHWAKADIEKMAAKYITTGVGGDKFNPEGTVSRAEFISWLVRALNLKNNTVEAVLPFGDVKTSKWYSVEINKAYSAGIATKEDGVSFRPDANITREEMAVMISRVLKLKLKGTELNQEQIKQKLKAFKDMNDIAHVNREAVAIAVDKQIITGRPGQLFAPGASATRAEGMVMIRRLLSKLQ